MIPVVDDKNIQEIPGGNAKELKKNIDCAEHRLPVHAPKRRTAGSCGRCGPLNRTTSIVVDINQNEMSVNVKIESIFKLSNKEYYLVGIRPEDSNQNWSIGENSFLGEAPLENFLQMPRKTDQHGNQDYNYFLVRLKNSEDRGLLEVGSVVELKE